MGEVRDKHGLGPYLYRSRKDRREARKRIGATQRVYLLTDHSPTAVFGVSSSNPHAMLGSRAFEALAFYCLSLRRLPKLDDTTAARKCGSVLGAVRISY